MRGRRCIGLAGSVSLVALAAPVAAQQTPPAKTAPQQQQQSDQSEDPNVIVVIGSRVIVASLADLAVEDSYDEDDVAAYGADSIGDILAEIQGEKGDDAPTLLVNGRPVADANDISDLPAEAVRKVEVLPRGAAQRVGGAAGQRAYNIVLKPAVRTATLTASREMATEGGWANNRGDITLTGIKKQDRINLSLRGAQSGRLYESERDFTPLTVGTPYAPFGNIIPASGAEVDPAFSLFAGMPVSIIAVPGGIAAPGFADLLAGANMTSASGQEPFRTLRGASRPIDLSVSGNKTLSPSFSLSLNGRLGWLRGSSGSGLPSARFMLPATHPDSPFSNSVVLTVNDPTRPLTSSLTTASRSLSATLNATLSTWRAAVNGRWDDRDSRYGYQSSGVPASATIPDSQSPFDGSLGALIPIVDRTSRSESSNRQLTADADGPLLALWAGTLRARVGVGATWLRSKADNFGGERDDHRRELLAKAGLTLPLTGEGFLGALGDSDLSVDLGVLDVGHDTIHRRSLAFNWQPKPWLRLSANAVRDGRPIAVELLSTPLTSFPNVPFFDPLTGETVDVTTVSGGASGLRPESNRKRSLALTLSPMPKYRLQFEAEYRDEETRDPLGFLPPASSALVAAFPDRYQRDSDGTLVLVDLRPINFARETLRGLNLRSGFSLPLGPQVPPKRGAPRKPSLKLALNASHFIVLKSTTVLREGFPSIDLEKGGAVGISSGQPRDRSSASLALTRGGSGIRAQWQRRGRAYLVTGTLADPDLLTFSPIATFDLKAFADLQQWAPKVSLLQKARLTLAVDNLFNRREQVRNLEDGIPQAYQPVRRDPVGRTVMVELRKQF